MVEVEGVEPSFSMIPQAVLSAGYPVTPVMDILVILVCFTVA